MVLGEGVVLAFRFRPPKLSTNLLEGLGEKCVSVRLSDSFVRVLLRNDNDLITNG